MQDIDKIELDMWAAKIKRAKNKLEKLEDNAADDPIKAIIDCNIRFKALLDNNKGEQRHTKEFNNRVNELAKIERKAKDRANDFNLIEALDAVNEAKLELNQLATKYANVKFSYSMKNKSS